LRCSTSMKHWLAGCARVASATTRAVVQVPAPFEPCVWAIEAAGGLQYDGARDVQCASRSRSAQVRAPLAQMS
jgi:hypothetical protein